MAAGPDMFGSEKLSKEAEEIAKGSEAHKKAVEEMHAKIMKMGSIPWEGHLEEVNKEAFAGYRRLFEELAAHGVDDGQPSVSDLFGLTMLRLHGDRLMAVGGIHRFEARGIGLFRGPAIIDGETNPKIRAARLHEFVRNCDERLVLHSHDLLQFQSHVEAVNEASILLRAPLHDHDISHHMGFARVALETEVKTLTGVPRAAAQGRLDELRQLQTRIPESAKLLEAHTKTLEIQTGQLRGILLLQQILAVRRGADSSGLAPELDRLSISGSLRRQVIGGMDGWVATLHKQAVAHTPALARLATGSPEYNQALAKRADDLIGGIRTSIQVSVTIPPGGGGAGFEQMLPDALANDVLEAHAIVAYQYMRGSTEGFNTWWPTLQQTLARQMDMQGQRTMANAAMLANAFQMGSLSPDSIPFESLGKLLSADHFDATVPLNEKSREDLRMLWSRYSGNFTDYTGLISRITAERRDPALAGWLNRFWNADGSGWLQSGLAEFGVFATNASHFGWTARSPLSMIYLSPRALLERHVVVGEQGVKAREELEKLEKYQKEIESADKVFATFRRRESAHLHIVDNTLGAITTLSGVASPSSLAYCPHAPFNPLRDEQFRKDWGAFEKEETDFEAAVKTDTTTEELSRSLGSAHGTAINGYIARLTADYQAELKVLGPDAEEIIKKGGAGMLREGMEKTEKSRKEGAMKRYQRLFELQARISGAYIFLLHDFQVKRVPRMNQSSKRLVEQLSKVVGFNEGWKQLIDNYGRLGVGVPGLALWATEWVAGTGVGAYVLYRMSGHGGALGLLRSPLPTSGIRGIPSRVSGWLLQGRWNFVARIINAPTVIINPGWSDPNGLGVVGRWINRRIYGAGTPPPSPRATNRPPPLPGSSSPPPRPSPPPLPSQPSPGRIVNRGRGRSGFVRLPFGPSNNLAAAPAVPARPGPIAAAPEARGWIRLGGRWVMRGLLVAGTISEVVDTVSNRDIVAERRKQLGEEVQKLIASERLTHVRGNIYRHGGGLELDFSPFLNIGDSDLLRANQEIILSGGSTLSSVIALGGSIPGMFLYFYFGSLREDNANARYFAVTDFLRTASPQMLAMLPPELATGMSLQGLYEYIRTEEPRDTSRPGPGRRSDNGGLDLERIHSLQSRAAAIGVFREMHQVAAIDLRIFDEVYGGSLAVFDRMLRDETLHEVVNAHLDALTSIADPAQRFQEACRRTARGLIAAFTIDAYQRVRTRMPRNVDLETFLGNQMYTDGRTVREAAASILASRPGLDLRFWNFYEPRMGIMREAMMGEGPPRPSILSVTDRVALGSISDPHPHAERVQFAGLELLQVQGASSYAYEGLPCRRIEGQDGNPGVLFAFISGHWYRRIQERDTRWRGIAESFGESDPVGRQARNIAIDLHRIEQRLENPDEQGVESVIRSRGEEILLTMGASLETTDGIPRYAIYGTSYSFLAGQWMWWNARSPRPIPVNDTGHRYAEGTPDGLGARANRLADLLTGAQVSVERDWTRAGEAGPSTTEMRVKSLPALAETNRKLGLALLNGIAILDTDTGRPAGPIAERSVRTEGGRDVVRLRIADSTVDYTFVGGQWLYRSVTPGGPASESLPATPEMNGLWNIVHAGRADLGPSIAGGSRAQAIVINDLYARMTGGALQCPSGMRIVATMDLSGLRSATRPASPDATKKIFAEGAEKFSFGPRFPRFTVQDATPDASPNLLATRLPWEPPRPGPRDIGPRLLPGEDR